MIAPRFAAATVGKRPAIPTIPEKYKNDSLSLLKEVGTKKFTEIINDFDSESR